jgi:glycosyltransferase involved in cell wall biosynthesis
MEDSGHEVELLYFGKKGKKIKESKHIFGHKIIQFPISFGKNEFGKEFSLPLLRYIKRSNTDIVHIHGYHQYNVIPILLTLFMKKIPVVIQNHGVGADYSKFRTKIYYKALKLFLKRVDMILSVSTIEIKNLKMAGIEESKIRYIPNGVDTSVFFPESKEEAREKLKLSQEKRYVLFVGRMSRFKGIEYLIKSIDLLKKEYLDLTLLLVYGGGFKDEIQRLKKLSEDLNINDSVEFVGSVPKTGALRTYYNAADICIFPSLSEPFGIVTIEALACKKPVVGTKGHIGGGVLKHEENALLAEIKSPESLAENISMLLDDNKLRDKLSSNGYDFVMNNLDWNKMGEKLNNIYAEIISRRENEG